MTTGRRTLIGLIVLVACGIAALLPLIAESREPRDQRELVLVTKRMAFYLDGAGTPNPTIQMRPGERLKIRLVNEDSGIAHDFALPALSASTETVHGLGETSMILQAPDQPGTTEYICTLHGRMMRGTLEVLPIPAGAAN
jgi:hypothetical protein